MKHILNFGYFVVLLLIALLFFIAIVKFDIIKVKSYTAEDFGIETLKSNVDKDNDGIDDYQDILEGARLFVQTNPLYKSKYYDGGYPNDDYYVCTDVIWKAFQNAGYNLKDLVDESIKNNKELYSIEVPDPNIDFRRVKNLNVFFKENLEEITIDTNEISSWQPGDIVVYKNHIAIVSDKRNKQGEPFIIHHAGQIRYEENKLTSRQILAHYRVNFINKEN